jgi:hypothetical protein
LVGKNIVRTKLLAIGCTSLQRAVHVVMRPADDELELAVEGALT